MSKNKTKVKKLALTLAMAQVFSVLPALPIANIAGLNNGSMVYAARTEYSWKKYSVKKTKIGKKVNSTKELYPEQPDSQVLKVGDTVRVDEETDEMNMYNFYYFKDENDLAKEEIKRCNGHGDFSHLPSTIIVTSIPKYFMSEYRGWIIKNANAGWSPYETYVKIKIMRSDNFEVLEIYKVNSSVTNVKGDYLNTVSSSDRNAYPDNGEKDGYYYEYAGATTIKNQAEEFNPSTKALSCKRNEKVDLKTGLTNAPSGATVTVTKDVDTSTVGEKTGQLTVKFSDGSTKVVSIKVNVTSSEGDEFNPTIEKVTVAWGKPLDITGAVKNLPDGAKLEDITNPKIDTKVSGDKTAKGKITFKDGSTKEVSIPVTVSKSESEGFTPAFKEITGVKGKPCDITKAITNLPNGASVKVVTPIDTNSVGTKTGKVEVTFADGSTKEVEVKAIIVDSNAANIVDGKFIDTIKEEVVLAGGTIDLTDNIVADGKYTVKDITDPKIDTSKQGQYKGKVRITFDNGDVVEAEVPVIVLEDVAALKDRIKKLEEELATANAKNTQLEQQVKDLKDKIAELEKQGKAKDAEIAKLKEEKKALEAQADLNKAEIEKLKGQIAGLNDLVAKKDAEIAGLKKQIKDLKDQVEKLTADNKKLQGDLDAANGKIKALEDENNGLKAKNQELTDKIAGLEKQVADKDNQIKALNDKINGLNKLIKELQDKINGLNGDLDKANQKIADAKKELEDLQKELQAKIDELNNKIADKEQQGKDLQKQLEDEKAKSDADQDKIKDLEDQIKKNADDEKALQDQKKGLEDQLAEKEAQIADLEKQAKDLQDKIAGLEEKIQDLINDKGLSQEEIDKLKADKANLQTELNDAKAKVQELEGKNSDLEKQLADAQARIKELEGQIGKLNDLIKQLQAKIDGLNKDLEGANQKVADAKKELADLQKELKAKIDELNNKIADKEQQGKDLSLIHI